MNIAIFSTRENAFVIDIFEKYPQYKVVAFVYTSGSEDKANYLKGLPLITVSTLQEKYPNEIDTIFFPTFQVCNAEYWSLRLKDIGITNIFLTYPIAIEQKQDFLQQGISAESSFLYMPSWNKPFLFRIEQHVTDKCNLNCKGCNNFSSLEHDPKPADSQHFERDMRRLAELFENICIIGLQGGEPFLEPELTVRMGKIARKYFPMSDIRVLTNGLLIPKTDDEIFKELRKLNITVHLSVYKPTENIIDDIRLKFENNNINYYIIGEHEKFGKYITEYPFEDTLWNTERCGSIGCHYLWEGYLYKCPETRLVKNLDDVFGTRIYVRDSGINVCREQDAFSIVRQLCSASYLCSYCAKKRRENFVWNNNCGYDKSDWIIPHRYEYEKEVDARTITDLKKCLDEEREINKDLEAKYHEVLQKQKEEAMKQQEKKEDLI